MCGRLIRWKETRSREVSQEAVAESLGQHRSSQNEKGRQRLEAICKKELHGCGI